MTPDYHQLEAAVKDRRLRGLDLRVLLVLQSWLGHERARWVKVATLANDLYLDPAQPCWSTPAQRASVGRALSRLQRFGYLRAGPKDGPRKTYTLATPLRTSRNTGATSRAA